MTDTPPKKTFDTALDELEATVRKLDSGELALEEALEVFERGVGLVRECQELLDEAERRIVELTETSQGIKETEHPSRGA
jgi:exodeoxyribonuclease VII small subunit